MAFNAAVTFGKNCAKVSGDTSAAGGATLIDMGTGVALPQVFGSIYVILRVFGRISGDWKIQSRIGTTNTDYSLANAASDNLDIPGLEWNLPASAEPRISGTDTGPELYVEYGIRNNVLR